MLNASIESISLKDCQITGAALDLITNVYYYYSQYNFLQE
jgi:hypothetical protein